MSTRYIWEKYTVNAEFKVVNTTIYYHRDVLPPNSWSLVGYISSGIELQKDETGAVIGAKQKEPVTAVYGGERYSASPNSNGYFFWGKGTYTEYARAKQSGYWAPESNGNYAALFRPSAASDSGQLEVDVYRLSSGKGDLIENVSSAKYSSYPTTSSGGESGGYWYTYKGSDSIDPQSIHYPTENLEAGKVIDVSLTPSASNKYGGTVTYKYQYSVNGGGWQDAATTMKESITFTIPDNTESIRFRVQASDNMGFTSSDYVTGDTGAVEQLKAYVGISGVARKVSKLYVGVDGKARQVVKGYIGVNGKAQRFL